MGVGCAAARGGRAVLGATLPFKVAAADVCDALVACVTADAELIVADSALSLLSERVDRLTRAPLPDDAAPAIAERMRAMGASGVDVFGSERTPAVIVRVLRASSAASASASAQPRVVLVGVGHVVHVFYVFGAGSGEKRARLRLRYAHRVVAHTRALTLMEVTERVVDLLPCTLVAYSSAADAGGNAAAADGAGAGAGTGAAAAASATPASASGPGGAAAVGAGGAGGGGGRVALALDLSPYEVLLPLSDRRAADADEADSAATGLLDAVLNWQPPAGIAALLASLSDFARVPESELCLRAACAPAAERTLPPFGFLCVSVANELLFVQPLDVPSTVVCSESARECHAGCVVVPSAGQSSFAVRLTIDAKAAAFHRLVIAPRAAGTGEPALPTADDPAITVEGEELREGGTVRLTLPLPERSSPSAAPSVGRSVPGVRRGAASAVAPPAVPGSTIAFWSTPARGSLGAAFNAETSTRPDAGDEGATDSQTDAAYLVPHALLAVGANVALVWVPSEAFAPIEDALCVTSARLEQKAVRRGASAPPQPEVEELTDRVRARRAAARAMLRLASSAGDVSCEVGRCVPHPVAYTAAGAELRAWVGAQFDECVHIYRGASSDVTALCASPAALVSGHADGSVNLWALPHLTGAISASRSGAGSSDPTTDALLASLGARPREARPLTEALAALPAALMSDGDSSGRVGAVALWHDWRWRPWADRPCAHAMLVVSRERSLDVYVSRPESWVFVFHAEVDENVALQREQQQQQLEELLHQQQQQQQQQQHGGDAPGGMLHRPSRVSVGAGNGDDAGAVGAVGAGGSSGSGSGSAAELGLESIVLSKPASLVLISDHAPQLAPLLIAVEGRNVHAWHVDDLADDARTLGLAKQAATMQDAAQPLRALPLPCLTITGQSAPLDRVHVHEGVWVAVAGAGVVAVAHAFIPDLVFDLGDPGEPVVGLHVSAGGAVLVQLATGQTVVRHLHDAPRASSMLGAKLRVRWRATGSASRAQRLDAPQRALPSAAGASGAMRR